MVARLWWVRHAPTHQKTICGQRDVPADFSDTAAVARLDTYLPKGATLVSSDLSRAVATADRLGDGRRRLPNETRLREFDFGEWDGMLPTAVAERDPEHSRAFWDMPGLVAAPGGECWNDVAERVTAAIDALAQDHPGVDLVAVAHLGVILSHLGAAGGLAPVQAIRHKLEPLSVTRLDREETGWRIVTINHVA